MKIVISSRNKNKIREIETLLSGVSSESIEMLSLDDICFYGEIEETGTSFEENALIKAQAAASSGYIAIADDSGLSVDALDGAPGVYSARYSGENATAESNNRKLLEELAGVPYEKRSARFVSVVACVFPDGSEPIIRRAECKGIILDAPRGGGGFGYDPLFYYEEAGITFAEMSPEEKNAVGHRGQAMRAFTEALRKRLAAE